MKTPVIGDIANPTIIAGTAPIQGPKYGMISVIAQNKANMSGAFNPANVNPTARLVTLRLILLEYSF